MLVTETHKNTDNNFITIDHVISLKLFILGHVLGGLGYTAVFDLVELFTCIWSVQYNLKFNQLFCVVWTTEVATKLLFSLAHEQNLRSPFLS